MTEADVALWRDPDWLAHRLDPASDRVLFVRLPREAHRRMTFLSDEYIDKDAERRLARLGQMPPGLPRGACHFVFHSAFCCSTLVARLLDLPGTAMALKEPAILNDIAGAALAAGDPSGQRSRIDAALRLLERPFGAGEAIVIKPSNVANPIAAEMLVARSDAHALLLYRPLRGFLASVAAKGMWGRIWARRNRAMLLRLPQIDPGYGEAERWLHTDLQVAALLWLDHQAQFARLAEAHPERVRTLDSETLLAARRESVEAIGTLFELGLSRADAQAIVDGPAFAGDSKRLGEAFEPAGKVTEAGSVADEIEMVAVWAEAVATHCGVPMRLGASLLDGALD